MGTVKSSLRKGCAKLIDRMIGHDLRHRVQYYVTRRICYRLVKQIKGQDLWTHAQIRCPKMHVGSGDGRFCICPNRITKDSVVYSFGVGAEISFELALIDRFGANVYAFDPTPESIGWVGAQELPEAFRFFGYGIADYDGVATFTPLPWNPTGATETHNYTLLDQPGATRDAVELEVHRLDTILHMLGHQRIDLLKMDIEGAEYAVIDDFCASDVPVRQLVVEFHHRFRDVGIERTRRAIDSLRSRGFKIFDVSPDGKEYSFILAG